MAMLHFGSHLLCLYVHPMNNGWFLLSFCLTFWHLLKTPG